MPKDPLAGLGLDDTPVTHRPSPPLLIWWGRFTALDFFFFFFVFFFFSLLILFFFFFIFQSSSCGFLEFNRIPAGGDIGCTKGNVTLFIAMATVVCFTSLITCVVLLCRLLLALRVCASAMVAVLSL